ncbi:ketopantoate reductase family protein [Desertibacillus haloalkaliphilus]|uniref:ketopantoate reductase family protein n=1 Tax=Desertibacillus haloalkaliphilus TaxID=1328930 RepID=UPI001C27F1EC|nr:ketopantoate reductase family protein [Desertibacillus haloalkaliphilus]MBU8906081.1 ketopantoate reductase family protein [Desertibacillus haloalkaliphilus]
MNIAVIGAGAVGGFVGMMLKKAGHDVTFLARGRHLDAMREQGLTLHHQHGTFTEHDTFTNQYEEISKADLLLFTVKSTETRQAIELIKPYKKANAFVLTLQNGVNNEEILADAFGETHVLSGAAHLSAKIEDPGVIRQEGEHIFYIGGLHPAQESYAEEVVRALQEAEVRCKLSSDIMRRKWEKSLWNVTFNPLSAITGAKVGEILDDPKLLQTSKQVFAEMLHISKLANIDISENAAERVFADAALVRNHKTSMLQDREQRKRMETESLCGYFVKLGRSKGLDVSVLGTIYSVLTFIDQAG